MSIDTYQQIIESLGIDRGRLSRGFDDYRTAPAPVVEDMDKPPCPAVPERLQSKGRPQTVADHRAKLRQCSPTYRALYESMLDRGVTVNSIADAIGINRTCVHKALHGLASAKVQEAVALRLSDTERGLMAEGIRSSGNTHRHARRAYNAI
jgi:hypothetical protein